MVEVVPATPAHAEALAPRMRTEDAAEVLASLGREPLEALLGSLEASSEAWTLLIDGEVAAMGGAVPFQTGAAIVWLLTGDLVERRPIVFQRTCRSMLAQLQERWPVLVQAIDARYTRAVRWAQHLGAEVGPAQSFGVGGLPFHPIVIRRRG